ncbi:MAG TPA: hypothetical protein VFF68_00415, partial [Anaerolineaceae bacterium]|nr:hypothetical protein [Anaerolineaceae bacterium]
RFTLLRLLPVPLLAAGLRMALDTQAAETLLAAHANAARDEMQALAGEFAQLAARSGRPTPCIDRLRAYTGPAAPLVEAQPGASRPAGPAPALLLAAAAALAAWLIRRRWKKSRA